MGLENNTSNRIFLSISDGKIAQRFPDFSEGLIKCTNKDNTKTWYEKRHDAVSGMVVNIEKRKTDWGDRLVIHIEDKGERFSLEMPWSSRYSNGFFSCMPNIEWSIPVTFSPWMKIIDNEKKTALYINQNSEGVKWAWTKDDPGELPPMVQMIVKGKTVWDDTARQAYFEAYLIENVIPKLKLFRESQPVKAEVRDQVGSAEVIDDLPF